MHHLFRYIPRPSGGIHSSTSNKTSTLYLEKRLDRAMLACEALWSIVREKLDVTDEELAQRMNDIDIADGTLDGKSKKTGVACPKCGRTIKRSSPKCMYCGQQIVHDPFS